MCDNIKISIIIPIYNAEKTIKRMLDSLQVQTMPDFEVIMVDDGSTDNSSVICDEYAKKDSRFKVIHQINTGVALARKKGIEAACGEYSIHADADDWVEATMLEDLYIKATKDDSEIVICDYFNTSSEGKSTYRKQNLTSHDPIDVLYQIIQGQCFGALWNKLIKTELYSKYNILFFKDVNYCEDTLALTQFLRHKEIKVSYLEKAYYHYIYNPESISRKISLKTYESIKLYSKLILNFLPNDTRFDSFKNSIPLGIFQAGFMNNLLSDNEIIMEFSKVKKEALKQAKSIRWIIGYYCLNFGFIKLAKQLIKY